jgi:hypothetical protein
MCHGNKERRRRRRRRRRRIRRRRNGAKTISLPNVVWET